MTAAITVDLPGAQFVYGGDWYPRGIHTAASLRWTPDRPDDAELMLGAQPWVFGLDVIREGLRGPAGVGEVFVCPSLHGPIHEIVLDNGDNRGALYVRSSDLREFVAGVDVARAHSTPAGAP